MLLTRNSSVDQGEKELNLYAEQNQAMVIWATLKVYRN